MSHGGSWKSENKNLQKEQTLPKNTTQKSGFDPSKKKNKQDTFCVIMYENTSKYDSRLF